MDHYETQYHVEELALTMNGVTECSWDEAHGSAGKEIIRRRISIREFVFLISGKNDFL